MSFVSISDFVGDRSIPNSGDRNVMDRLNWFIEKYEPDCLYKVLGWELYNLVLNPYVEGGEIDDLINGTDYLYQDSVYYWPGIKPMIVDYVYYHYMNDAATANSGKGVIIPKSEMTFNISSAQKMIDAWNEFVKYSANLTHYVGAFPLEYPTYPANKFGTVNEFDI